MTTNPSVYFLIFFLFFFSFVFAPTAIITYCMIRLTRVGLKSHNHGVSEDFLEEQTSGAGASTVY